MISKQFQSILSCLVVSAALVYSSLLCATETNTLYFYSPEVSHSRNTVLKGTFDQYLSAKGGVEFQPVKKQEVFEELMLSNRAEALIMSSHHFHQLLISNPELTKHYRSVLQGEKNGSETYLNSLVSKKEFTGFDGQILASSRNKAQTHQLLYQMFPGKLKEDFEALSILEVPKDIDALMAVGFGLSDFGLTTNDSLATLSALYKEQYSQVKIIGNSIPQKRLVLILSKSVLDDEVLIGGLVYSMPQSTLGRRAMKLLGLDSWRWLQEKGFHQGGTE